MRLIRMIVGVTCVVAGLLMIGASVFITETVSFIETVLGVSVQNHVFVRAMGLVMLLSGLAAVSTWASDTIPGGLSFWLSLAGLSGLIGGTILLLAPGYALTTELGDLEKINGLLGFLGGCTAIRGASFFWIRRKNDEVA